MDDAGEAEGEASGVSDPGRIEGEGGQSKACVEAISTARADPEALAAPPGAYVGVEGGNESREKTQQSNQALTFSSSSLVL